MGRKGVKERERKQEKVREQKLEKDKRSAGAANVAFEERSFRPPSPSDATHAADAKDD